MTEARARYDVTIERDDDGLPTRLFYSPSTPVYPDVAVESHDPPCAWCGGEVKPHFAASDLDLCTVCATPRVRPTAKPAAAASPLDAIRAQVAPYEAQMKPCPFCGSSAMIHWSERQTSFWPGCTNEECGGDMDHWRSLEDTVIAWNSRAAAASRDASLTAFVDDLLDVLQEIGGMSAEWCETKLQEYEKLLREG